MGYTDFSSPPDHPNAVDRRSVTPRPQRYAIVLAIAGVYLLACGIMLSPICNFAKLGTASYEGDARAFIWVLAWDNHALLDHVPSLFDANKLYPLPNALAYGEHLYGISLFTLPIYALTRNPVLAYNLVWILSYLLAAGAAHLLAWRYTHDQLAATLAGLASAFCFFRMHHGHGHLNLIWSFWIPLSFIAMDRWVAKPTWTRLSALVVIVVFQALASWYEAVLITVADAVFFLWLVAAERLPAGALGARTNAAARTSLLRLALQGLVGALVVLAIVWPFARHYFILHGDTPAFSSGASADLAGWLVPPENTFVGQWLLAHDVKGPRWIWGEVTVYLGWVTLALAAIGAVVSVRSRDPLVRRNRFFIVLAVVAGVLALGPSSSEVATGRWGWSPFGMLAHVPGLSLFRIPARYSQLLNLALASLAAVACAASHRRFGHVGRVVTVAAMLLLLADFYVVKFPGGSPQPFAVPQVYKHVATLPEGALVSLPDYANTPLWFQEANYSYFSTAHWHPVVNGDSREWPAEFLAMTARVKLFPEPDAAAAMRAVKISYVVVHASLAGAKDMLAPAKASPDFRLLARFDDDYLFEVLTAGTH
jgi:hypothetical protein